MLTQTKMTETKTKEALSAENEDLRKRLEEAEETLRAIRGGEVDALVVGNQVYTLESAAATSNRFRGDALTQVNEAVIAVDNDQHVTYLNPAAERLYGVNASDVLGYTLNRIRCNRWLHPADEAAAWKAINQRGYWRGETLQTKLDGEELLVESTVSCMRDANGTVIGLLAVVRDVTARKQAESALRESEARLAIELADTQQLQNISSQMIHEENVDVLYGQILDAATQIMRSEMGSLRMFDPEKKALRLLVSKGFNPAVAEFLQWATADSGSACGVAVKTGKRFIVPDIDESELQADVCNLERYRQLGIRAVQSTPLVSREGRIVGTISSHWPGIHHPSERDLRLLDLLARQAADLIERKQGAERLRQSEAEFRQLANAVPQIVWVNRGDGEFEYVNEQWTDFSGLTLAETKESEQRAGIFHPEDHPKMQAVWKTALAEGSGLEVEVRMRSKSGDYRWFLIRSQPTKDATGKVIKWFGTSTDITATKLTEQALRDSESKLRLAINAAAMTTWELNLKTGVRKLGSNYAQVFGSSLRTTQEFVTALHPDDRQRVLDSIKEALDGKKPYRLQYRTLDPAGKVQWVESFGQLTYDNNGQPEVMLGVALNITERKQAEEKIQTANYRFRLAEEAAHGFSYEWNLVSGAVTRSASLQSVLGYKTGELQNNWEAWAALLHPDERVQTQTEVIEFLKQHSEETYDFEYRARHQQGHYIWLHERAIILRNELNQPVRVIGQTVDISKRKEAETERERLLAQEQQARSTAEAATRAKDEFLAVVSHELRNPLNAILGYTRLTKAQAHDAAAVVHHCEIVERNAKMQQQLIEDLLDTARIITGKLRIEAAPTDLRLVLEEALAVVQPAAAAKQIELVCRLGNQPQPVIGDEARLQQVVWNLMQNAIKFTHNGGRVELRLEHQQDHVLITVSDNGQGIEPAFLDAVFDRFSQLDMARTRRYGGLGLGLALVKDLVELHGGTISVSSAGAGHGATFTVKLPLCAPQALITPLRFASEAQQDLTSIPLIDLPRLDGIHALVVDDHEEGRDIVAKTLREWGATVTTAASGPEARAWLTQQTFDVLVCDIAMPVEDGYTVIQHYRALEQERGVPLSQRLPAIALTALARAEDRMQALAAGFQTHLAKPVELAELVVVIQGLVRKM